MLIPKYISNIPCFSRYFEKNKEFEKKYEKFGNSTQHNQKCSPMLGCAMDFERFEFENSDNLLLKSIKVLQ